MIGRHVIYLANRYPEKTLRVQTETGSQEEAHEEKLLGCGAGIEGLVTQAQGGTDL